MPRFSIHDAPTLIWTGDLVLDGRLTIPNAAPGLILMPGLGGTFHSGIRGLAAHFHDNGFATLIADVLTPDEQQFDARTRHFRADLPLLADRIAMLAGWLKKEEMTRELPAAFFGSGILASAALFAAASGRADFFAFAVCYPRLGVLRGIASGIRTPTLIVMEETASPMSTAGVLNGEVRIERITSVNPLLDSPAAMEEVAQKTLLWFRNHVPVAVTAA